MPDCLKYLYGELPRIREAHKSVWLSFGAIAVLTATVTWWVVDLRYADRFQTQDERGKRTQDDITKLKEEKAKLIADNQVLSSKVAELEAAALEKNKEPTQADANQAIANHVPTPCIDADDTEDSHFKNFTLDGCEQAISMKRAKHDGIDGVTVTR